MGEQLEEICGCTISFWVIYRADEKEDRQFTVYDDYEVAVEYAERGDRVVFVEADITSAETVVTIGE